MQITLKELFERVCKMIEEYEPNSPVLTSDEEIMAKLPIAANQGIKKIYKVKPIPRKAILRREDAEEFGELLLYPMPTDMYRLRNVDTCGVKYNQMADGNNNFISIRNTFEGDIFIQYDAFHAEIFAKSPIDTTMIELTQECLLVLEHYVAAQLTADNPEFYAHFFTEYQNGLKNLGHGGRQQNLVSFEDY